MGVSKPWPHTPSLALGAAKGKAGWETSEDPSHQHVPVSEMLTKKVGWKNEEEEQANPIPNFPL